MADKTVKLLPQDLNAEAAVLSAMMIDNFVVARALELLSEEHFYRTAHKNIHTKILQHFYLHRDIHQ